jgi:hypothetical protein
MRMEILPMRTLGENLALVSKRLMNTMRNLFFISQSGSNRSIETQLDPNNNPLCSLSEFYLASLKMHPPLLDGEIVTDLI